MLCPSQIHSPGCPCQQLRSLYGRGLFKCDRFRCQYYRVGFDTRSDRDSHLRIHNRPFKCPEPNCEFADIGFISEKDLSRHRSKTHQYHLSDVKDTASEIPADQLKPEELISILKDAIEADEVEFVRSQYARAEEVDGLQHWPFVEAAARTASPTMVDLLLEKYASINPDDTTNEFSALCAAIRGENMVVIKHLIARGAFVDPQGGSAIKVALETCNPEIVEILLSHTADLVECPSMFDRLLSTGEKREEDEILKVLHQMHKYVVGKKAFSSGFIDALWRGSIPLAKYFIDNGADVNSRRRSGPPVLYDLVLGFSRRHVEAIKFLLQQGADPYPTNSRSQSIKSLFGMRKVEKYFGKSWDDLVKETQPERASTTNEG
jgi:Ankyrin repeats (3 copies)